MSRSESFCRGIDTFNEWVGKIVSIAVIPMTIFVSLEVILRYVFSRPTVWVWDVNVQLLGLMAMVGAGFTLLHGGHVIMDLFIVRFTPKRRAILEILTSLLFFLVVGVMLWKLGQGAQVSLQISEKGNTFFAPPVYPLKVLLAVGVFLLILQGIAKLIRNINIAFRPGITQSR